MFDYIEGYACTYNAKTSKATLFLPGCFDEFLKNLEFYEGALALPMLAEHRGSLVGYWTSIVSDEKGLYVKGYALANEFTRGMGEFSVCLDPIAWHNEGDPLEDFRVVEKSGLREISLTTHGACPGSEILKRIDDDGNPIPVPSRPEPKLYPWQTVKSQDYLRRLLVSIVESTK